MLPPVVKLNEGSFRDVVSAAVPERDEMERDDCLFQQIIQGFIPRFQSCWHLQTCTSLFPPSLQTTAPAAGERHHAEATLTDRQPGLNPGVWVFVNYQLMLT